MQKLLSISLLLLCAACGTSLQREAPSPAAPPPSPAPQADAPPADPLNEMVLYAMSLADTPYRYGGASPATGFDCSGFVRHVFQQSLGLTLPRTSHEMSIMGERLAHNQLRPGDLVFFNTLRKPFSHVGIYVGEDKFVHAPKAGKAVTLASLKESYWRTRYDGARRISTH